MGCHFLLQCMKVKSESEVAQSCPTLRDPMDCSLPGSSIHGIASLKVKQNGGPLPSPSQGSSGTQMSFAGTDIGILFQGRVWGLWKVPAQMRPVLGRSSRLPHTGTTRYEWSRGNALRVWLRAALAETHLISGAYKVGFITEPTPTLTPAKRPASKGRNHSFPRNWLVSKLHHHRAPSPRALSLHRCPDTRIPRQAQGSPLPPCPHCTAAGAEGLGWGPGAAASQHQVPFPWQPSQPRVIVHQAHTCPSADPSDPLLGSFSEG